MKSRHKKSIWVALTCFCALLAWFLVPAMPPGDLTTRVMRVKSIRVYDTDDTWQHFVETLGTVDHSVWPREITALSAMPLVWEGGRPVPEETVGEVREVTYYTVPYRTQRFGKVHRVKSFTTVER